MYRVFSAFLPTRSTRMHLTASLLSNMSARYLFTVDGRISIRSLHR